MKSLVLLFALLGSMLLVTAVSPTSNASNTNQKHRAVTRFDSPVTLRGVVLQGDYLFVHDDAAMQRGEACTFVYKGTSAVASKLVASFHCTPVERAKAEYFTVRTAQNTAGINELREFQFSGETEAHQIPAN